LLVIVISHVFRFSQGLSHISRRDGRVTVTVT